jgi:hypothetical protein
MGWLGARRSTPRPSVAGCQAAPPTPRHRAKVAQILDRPEHQLWPETSIPAVRDDARREILGAWAHANDLSAPDWRTMLRQATQSIELLGCSLVHVLTAGGVIDTLAAKGQAGCEIRVLIAAADSIWVDGAAQQLGQDEEDYVGNTTLRREIELVRGHLESLLESSNFELHRFYTDRFNSILRFDEQMLVTLNLWGTPVVQAPMLHLRRGSDDGLFDQFAEQFEAIWQNASEPPQPSPDAYPPPGEHPERYAPITQAQREADPAPGQE